MKKRIIALALCLAITIPALTGCMYNSSDKDTAKTFSIGDELAQKQATPTDFDYSLERYNLIRRAYWVNGQRQKAASIACPIADVPLSYILLIGPGVMFGPYIVDGKISSLNSFLTPDEALVFGQAIDRVPPIKENGLASTSQSYMAEMPDVDGSYGANDGGIFFFTTTGAYKEWNGSYFYDSEPINLEDVTVLSNGNLVYNKGGN